MAVVGNSMTLNAGTTITSGGRTTRIAYETAGLGQFTNNVAGLNIQAADGAALYAVAGIAPAGYTSTAPDAVVFNGLRVNGNLLNEQQLIGQWIHPYQGEVGAADLHIGQRHAGGRWRGLVQGRGGGSATATASCGAADANRQRACECEHLSATAPGRRMRLCRPVRPALPAARLWPRALLRCDAYLRDLLHGNEMTGDKAGPCNVARPYL